jgi:hypothetical protein
MKSFFPLRCTALALAALGALSGISFAQNRIDSAAQQVERLNLIPRLQTPALDAISSLYEDEDKDVGPQVLIRQKARHSWLEASTDVQFGSTSNATQYEGEKIETSLMISTVQAALTPPAWKVPGGELSAKLGYRHQKFNYGIATGGNESSINESDFDVSSFFMQWRYLFHEKWVAMVGLDHNRLLSADGGAYEEFYSEFAPNVSLQRSFALGKKSAFSASLGVGGHISHVDDPYTDHYDRVDESATFSYTRELFQGLVFQPFYRAQLTQYTRNHERKDVIHSVGLILAYALTNDISLRTFANFEARDSSDVTIEDYQKVDTGLGMSLRIQF